MEQRNNAGSVRAALARWVWLSKVRGEEMLPVLGWDPAMRRLPSPIQRHGRYGAAQKPSAVPSAVFPTAVSMGFASASPVLFRCRFISAASAGSCPFGGGLKGQQPYLINPNDFHTISHIVSGTYPLYMVKQKSQCRGTLALLRPDWTKKERKNMRELLNDRLLPASQCPQIRGPAGQGGCPQWIPRGRAHRSRALPAYG